MEPGDIWALQREEACLLVQGTDVGRLSTDMEPIFRRIPTVVAAVNDNYIYILMDDA